MIKAFASCCLGWYNENLFVWEHLGKLRQIANNIDYCALIKGH